MAALISDDGDRAAKAGNPDTEEGTGAGFSGDVREGDGLQPAGKSVDNGEEILLALCFRERTDNVKVQILKTPIRHGERSEGSSSMAGDLGPLARQARPAEGLNLGRHAAPDETPANVAKKSVAALVDQAVRTVQQAGNQRSRDDGTWRSRSQRGVTEETWPSGKRHH